MKSEEDSEESNPQMDENGCDQEDNRIINNGDEQVSNAQMDQKRCDDDVNRIIKQGSAQGSYCRSVFEFTPLSYRGRLHIL